MRRAAGHAVILVSAWTVARPAAALPVLGFILEGGPGDVGRGGSGLAESPGFSPTLSMAQSLLGSSRGLIDFSAQDELTLDIRTGRFQGTRNADDHQQLLLGSPVGGRSFLAAFAGSVRSDSGAATYADSSRGLNLRLTERRLVGEVAAAARAGPGLEVGGAFERTTNGGMGYTLSAMESPLPWLTLGYVRHAEPIYELIDSPPIRAKRLTTPPADVVVNQTVTSNWFLGRIGRDGLESTIEADSSPNHDLRAGVAGRLGPVRIDAAYDRRALGLSANVDANGPTIADARLDLLRTRVLARASAETPIGVFVGGGTHTVSRGSLSANEVANGLGRALLKVDQSLGGYFSTATGIDTNEAFLGYRAQPLGMDLDLGARYVHLRAVGGVANYGVSLLQIQSSDGFQGATVDMVGGTAGLAVHLGDWTFRGAIAQFVPVAMQLLSSSGTPTPPPSPPTARTESHSAPNPNRPSLWDQLKQALHDYAGGHYAMLQVSRAW